MTIAPEIQKFLELLLTGIAVACAGYALAKLPELKSALVSSAKAHFSDAQIDALMRAAQIAVTAAQRAGLDKFIKSEGSRLMNYAIEKAQQYLDGVGMGHISVTAVVLAVRDEVDSRTNSTDRAVLDNSSGWDLCEAEKELHGAW